MDVESLKDTEGEYLTGPRQGGRDSLITVRVEEFGHLGQGRDSVEQAVGRQQSEEFIRCLADSWMGRPAVWDSDGVGQSLEVFGGSGGVRIARTEWDQDQVRDAVHRLIDSKAIGGSIDDNDQSVASVVEGPEQVGKLGVIATVDVVVAAGKLVHLVVRVGADDNSVDAAGQGP